MRRLMEGIRELTLADKKALYEELGRQIALEEEANISLRKVESLQEIIRRVMGLDSFLYTSRRKEYVTARMIATNILLQMGHTELQVGLMMNKNHSTIHHSRDMMRAWKEHPWYYRKELALFNRIKTEFYEANTRTI